MCLKLKKRSQNTESFSIVHADHSQKPQKPSSHLQSIISSSSKVGTQNIIQSSSNALTKHPGRTRHATNFVKLVHVHFTNRYCASAGMGHHYQFWFSAFDVFLMEITLERVYGWALLASRFRNIIVPEVDSRHTSLREFAAMLKPIRSITNRM